MIKKNHIEESVLYNLELKSNKIKINDFSWLLLFPPPPPQSLPDAMRSEFQNLFWQNLNKKKLNNTVYYSQQWNSTVCIISIHNSCFIRW